jgi:hypothetical protein
MVATAATVVPYECGREDCNIVLDIPVTVTLHIMRDTKLYMLAKALPNVDPIWDHELFFHGPVDPSGEDKQ